MRHYDGQIWDLFKFTFTSYSALIGITIGIYQFSVEKGVNLIPAAVGLLTAGFLFGLFMFSLIIRNRVYYVCVSRYVNEHRGFFMKFKPEGFANASRMYTSSSFPRYFNWRSSQSIFSYLVSVLNAILLASLIYILLGPHPYRQVFVIGIFVIGTLIQVLFGICYLLSREGKSTMKAVFGKK